MKASALAAAATERLKAYRGGGGAGGVEEVEEEEQRWPTHCTFPEQTPLSLRRPETELMPNLMANRLRRCRLLGALERSQRRWRWRRCRR